MIKKIVTLLMIFITVLVSGCNKKNDSMITEGELSLLEAEVYYTSIEPLPEGAKLEVRLEEFSKMDVAPKLISHAIRRVQNTPPYTLQVTFPNKLIKAKRRYNLSASITLDDKLLFTSTTHINPFEVGVTSPVKVPIGRVGAE